MAVYAPLVAVSWMAGGHCNGSPILLLLSGEDCPNGSRPVITPENANDPVGASPDCGLVFAISANNAAVFNELLSKGAKPELCRGFPDRLFEVSVRCRNGPAETKEIFAVLERLGVRHANANRLLISQAKELCVPGMELAMLQGADANAESAEGLTALHYTTRFADSESISATAALVRLGADSMRKTSKADSAYVLARQQLSHVGNWPLLDSAMTGSTGR